MTEKILCEIQQHVSHFVNFKICVLMKLRQCVCVCVCVWKDVIACTRIEI